MSPATPMQPLLGSVRPPYYGVYGIRGSDIPLGFRSVFATGMVEFGVTQKDLVVVVLSPK